jgi:hypothetical protein
MAKQMIYKDLGIVTEATFGVSATAVVKRLHVVSCSIAKDPNETYVEDTSGFAQGRDRIVAMKNTYEGDIVAIGTPRNIHEMLELAMGSAGISVALGTSMEVITYRQGVDTLTSKAITMDRNSSQESFLGVRGGGIELTASDGFLQVTVPCIAQTRMNGITLPDSAVGETLHPYTFADFTATIHAGSTYGAQPVTHLVSEWNVKYDNGLEAIHLSGSYDPARSDHKMPTVEGKLKIFHNGSSWIDATYGQSVFYIRLQGSLPSAGGLINGTTPYLLRLDIPRAELTTNVRNYEQAALAVEEIEFKGMFDNSALGTSAIFVPSLTSSTIF